MQDSNCIFCKIINKQIPSDVVFEDDDILVIKDINPKAPIHYLIIPKEHIKNINDLEEKHSDLIWKMIKVAKKLASKLDGAPSFNLVSNNGKEAGQIVFHLHWHFLAGKNLGF
ncbi:MAG: histidine triad nucleotide-binding protein [bacterium]